MLIFCRSALKIYTLMQSSSNRQLTDKFQFPNPVVFKISFRFCCIVCLSKDAHAEVILTLKFSTPNECLELSK